MELLLAMTRKMTFLKCANYSNSAILAGDKVTTGGLGNFNVADIPVGEVVVPPHRVQTI